jgi:4-alpha-glucanotransferase
MAGLLVPLFALRGARDQGVGEIGDLGPFCRWVAAAGHRLVQLLPIGELSPGERSPYSAVTGFAIDPIYLSLDRVEDLAGSDRDEVAVPSSGIDYDAVRRVKRRALEAAFTRFMAVEWRAKSTRARAFHRFREAEADWLDDYALFRACQEQNGSRSWRDWDAALAARDPSALARARDSLARERLFHEYVQWLAAGQWEAARREAAAAGVCLKGDLPFVLSTNSADVWARQAEFDLEATLGAPPDAFNTNGQEWGLPVCRWDVMADGDFAWLRARARRAAALFDAFRLDHVVGLYRQWVIARDGSRGFVPADEAEQLALGERLLALLRAAAGTTTVIGEDLGVVPPFVRRSLARLRIPGYRVLRWEDDDGVFRDPAGYPRCSVATTGTHDTSALASWWEDELEAAQRGALAEVASFGPLCNAGPEFTADVHETLLDGIYGAGSDLVVIPFPDAYGGRERINVPATTGPQNWNYRLPWSLPELAGADGDALAARLRALATRHDRA